MKKFVRHSGLSDLFAAAPCLAVIAMLWAFFGNAKLLRADIDMQAGVGYSALGTLDAEPECNVKATPLTLGVNFEGKINKQNRYMLGVAFQHQFISYVQDSGNFSGSNLLVGVGLGWNLMNLQSGFVRLEGFYYPYNILTVTSESKATVNDVEYSHSTLTTLTGPGATEVRLAYIIEQKGGQFNKYERLRYGLLISQLMQPFTKSEVRIATSNSAITPRTKVKTEIEQTLTLTSVFLVAGFAF